MPLFLFSGVCLNKAFSNFFLWWESQCFPPISCPLSTWFCLGAGESLQAGWPDSCEPGLCTLSQSRQDRCGLQSFPVEEEKVDLQRVRGEEKALSHSPRVAMGNLCLRLRTYLDCCPPCWWSEGGGQARGDSEPMG